MSQVPTSVINSIVVDKEVAEELAKVYDPAGCGVIYKKRFVNRAVHMYKSYHYLRKCSTAKMFSVFGVLFAT